MNKLIPLSAAMLAMASICVAAEPSSAVKDAVLKAESAWKEAVLNADRPALEKLVADDLSYTHSSGKTQSKEQFITEATGGALHYKAIDFETALVRQYGNTVVITHPTTITTTETGTSHLYICEVWAKLQGRWQLASRLATKLP